MDNVIVQATIEECLADNVSPDRFPYELKSTLTATIAYKRGIAPEEVAILNDQGLLDQIAIEYKKQYGKKQ